MVKNLNCTWIKSLTHFILLSLSLPLSHSLSHSLPTLLKKLMSKRKKNKDCVSHMTQTRITDCICFSVRSVSIRPSGCVTLPGRGDSYCRLVSSCNQGVVESSYRCTQLWLQYMQIHTIVKSTCPSNSKLDVTLHMWRVTSLQVFFFYSNVFMFCSECWTVLMYGI